MSKAPFRRNATCQAYTTTEKPEEIRQVVNRLRFSVHESTSNFLHKFKKKYWLTVGGLAVDLSLELIGAVTWQVLKKGAL